MAESTCSVQTCHRPPHTQGMCQRHWTRTRELHLSLGLPVPRPMGVSPYRTPKAPRPKVKPDDGSVCIVDECWRAVGLYGGEGRCRDHFIELVAEHKAANLPAPVSNRSLALRNEPGYEVEDWPEDQHAGLSVDGMCSVRWGCDRPVNSKTGRGLCGRHYQRWQQAYKRRGLPVPKRASGRDPRCTMPSDDALVALIREHGSYAKTAKAVGVVPASLQCFLERRPELKARMDAEWRLIYKPRLYSDEERKERAREQSRANGRKRRAVSAERMAYAGVTEQDAQDAFDYMTVLDGDPCCYCGQAGGEIDHIQPLIHFGDVRWVNLTASCKRCNSSKVDRPLLQFMLATIDERGARTAELYADGVPGRFHRPGSQGPVQASTGLTEVVSTSPEQLGFDLMLDVG